MTTLIADWDCYIPFNLQQVDNNKPVGTVEWSKQRGAPCKVKLRLLTNVSVTMLYTERQRGKKD